MARPISSDSFAPSDDDLDPDAPVPVGMKRTRSGKIKRRNIIWRLRKVLVGLVVVSVLATSAAAANYVNSVEPLAEYRPPETSYLCAADVPDGTCGRDNAFAEFATADAGVNVRSDQIPRVMIEALVAAEDKDFFNHSGVDPAGIGRAAWASLRKSGGGRQGGSTLTQQLVKNLTRDDALTMERKVKEAVQAMRLEQELPKIEIITRYFNSIYYGRNAVSLNAAVRAYFGPTVRVEDIDLPKAAYLAAIIREPELVDANRQPTDPLRDKQRKYATTRRANVLDTMLAQGYITQAQRDEVAAMGWDYVVERPTSREGAVRDQYQAVGGTQWRLLVEDFIGRHTPITAEQLRTEGLRIYTSMDPNLQRLALQAVQENLTEPNDVEAAMAAIDENGYLRAMVPNRTPGSKDINLADLDANACQGCTSRKPGSVLKPFVLAEYLSQGRDLDKQYENRNSVMVQGRPVENSEENEKSPATVIEATAMSSNTIFVGLIQEIGVARTIELFKKFGIDTDAWVKTAADDVDPRNDPRAAIGQHGASVIDVASAYAVLANRGVKVEAGPGSGPSPVTRITDAKGKVLWPVAEPARTEVIKPDVAEGVNYTLRQVIESPDGTARERGRVPGQIVAGKTGTTGMDKSVGAKDAGISDAWFAEYTCRLTAVGWVGHDDGVKDLGGLQGFPKVFGGTIPAKMVAQFMAAATAGQTSCPFERPASMAPKTTTTSMTSTTVRERSSTTERDRDRDDDDDDRPRDRTSTSRRPPFTVLPWPPTTDRDDRTTTTRDRVTTTRGVTSTTDPPGRPGRPDTDN